MYQLNVQVNSIIPVITAGIFQDIESGNLRYEINNVSLKYFNV